MYWDEIKDHCVLHDRIPRAEVLRLMTQSRIMLAPSLVDGVPNTLYEAMAAEAFPIVSPLDTIKTVVNEENAIFVNNKDPQEIADALIRAMNDDELVDTVTKRNLALVKKIADRKTIQLEVVGYYQSII